MIGVTLFFLIIWKFGIKGEFFLPKAVWFLAIFWFVCLFSLIFSGNLKGGLYFLRFFLYSLSFYLGYSLILSKIVGFEKITKKILLLVISLAGLGFLQLIFFPDIGFLTDYGYDPHKDRLVATILDPNLLGVILNIGLVISVFHFLIKKNKVWIFTGLVIFLAIILTFSRSAYLMMGVEILIIGWFRMKKLILVLLLIFGLLFLSLPRFRERIVGGFSFDVTARERVESWSKGIYVFQNKPFFGVGFNNLREYMSSQEMFKVFSPDGGNSGSGVDSSLIFVLATTGAVGFLAYVLFWGNILKNLVKDQGNFKIFLMALFGGLFINSFFINSLFFPPVIFLVFLLSGSYYADSKK